MTTRSGSPISRASEATSAAGSGVAASTLRATRSAVRRGSERRHQPPTATRARRTSWAFQIGAAQASYRPGAGSARGPRERPTSAATPAPPSSIGQVVRRASGADRHQRATATPATSKPASRDAGTRRCGRRTRPGRSADGDGEQVVGTARAARSPPGRRRRRAAARRPGRPRAPRRPRASRPPRQRPHRPPEARDRAAHRGQRGGQHARRRSVAPTRCPSHPTGTSRKAHARAGPAEAGARRRREHGHCRDRADRGHDQPQPLGCHGPMVAAVRLGVCTQAGPAVPACAHRCATASPRTTLAP